MELGTNLSLLFIGLIIGLAVAAVGAVVEYWRSLRSDLDEGPQELPSCLLFVLGGLVLAAIAIIAASLFLNGGIVPALIISAGVLAGFYIGFIFLFILWYLFGR